jgi:hypothetical protein
VPALYHFALLAQALSYRCHRKQRSSAEVLAVAEQASPASTMAATSA